MISSCSKMSSVIATSFVIMIRCPEERVHGQVFIKVTLGPVNLRIMRNGVSGQVLKNPVWYPVPAVIGEDVVIERADVVQPWEPEFHYL